MRVFLFIVLFLTFNHPVLADHDSSHFGKTIISNETFTQAGYEVPWPMIVTPAWVMKPDWPSIVGRERYGDEFRDSNNNIVEVKEQEFKKVPIGFWEEMNSRNPKIFYLGHVEKWDDNEKQWVAVGFTVQEFEKKNRTIVSTPFFGFGDFNDWTESESWTESRNYENKKVNLKKQKAKDPKGYYFLLWRERKGKPGKILKLVHFKKDKSKKNFLLAAFILEDDARRNYLLRYRGDCINFVDPEAQRTFWHLCDDEG